MVMVMVVVGVVGVVVMMVGVMVMWCDGSVGDGGGDGGGDVDGGSHSLTRELNLHLPHTH